MHIDMDPESARQNFADFVKQSRGGYILSLTLVRASFERAPVDRLSATVELGYMGENPSSNADSHNPGNLRVVYPERRTRIKSTLFPGGTHRQSPPVTEFKSVVKPSLPIVVHDEMPIYDEILVSWDRLVMLGRHHLAVAGEGVPAFVEDLQSDARLSGYLEAVGQLSAIALHQNQIIPY